MTQKSKLINAFSKGEALTAKQITTRLKIASPSKVVSRLRLDDGYNIQCKEHKDSKGRVTNKYQLMASKRKASRSVTA